MVHISRNPVADNFYTSFQQTYQYVINPTSLATFAYGNTMWGNRPYVPIVNDSSSPYLWDDLANSILYTHYTCYKSRCDLTVNYTGVTPCTAYLQPHRSDYRLALTSQQVAALEHTSGVMKRQLNNSASGSAIPARMRYTANTFKVYNQENTTAIRTGAITVYNESLPNYPWYWNLLFTSMGGSQFQTTDIFRIKMTVTYYVTLTRRSDLEFNAN